MGYIALICSYVSILSLKASILPIGNCFFHTPLFFGIVFHCYYFSSFSVLVMEMEFVYSQNKLRALRSQELVQHVSVHSGSNWNLAELVFEEMGKLEYLEKKPLGARREPTTNSTHIYDARTGNRTRATFGGRRVPLHHLCSPIKCYHVGWVFSSLFFPFPNPGPLLEITELNFT